MTLTETLNKNIDSFHRRMLRKYVLDSKYPKVVNNERVYELTKADPWSKTIAIGRMKWLEHVSRSPKNTPATRAITYANQSGDQ